MKHIKSAFLVFIGLSTGIAFVYSCGSGSNVTAGPSGTSAVEAYDANGQYLGRVLDAYPDVVVHVPSISGNLMINAEDGTALPASGSLAFGTTDCSGVPHIATRLANVMVSNGGKFYKNNGEPPRNVHILSSLSADGAICSSKDFIQSLLPLKEVTLPFPVPVALPLRFE